MMAYFCFVGFGIITQSSISTVDVVFEDEASIASKVKPDDFIYIFYVCMFKQLFYNRAVSI